MEYSALVTDMGALGTRFNNNSDLIFVGPCYIQFELGLLQYELLFKYLLFMLSQVDTRDKSFEL